MHAASLAAQDSASGVATPASTRAYNLLRQAAGMLEFTAREVLPSLPAGSAADLDPQVWLGLGEGGGMGACCWWRAVGCWGEGRTWCLLVGTSVHQAHHAAMLAHAHASPPHCPLQLLRALASTALADAQQLTLLRAIARGNQPPLIAAIAADTAELYGLAGSQVRGLGCCLGGLAVAKGQAACLT